MDVRVIKNRGMGRIRGTSREEIKNEQDFGGTRSVDEIVAGSMARSTGVWLVHLRPSKMWRSKASQGAL